jgi:hypothetical protein
MSVDHKRKKKKRKDFKLIMNKTLKETKSKMNVISQRRRDKEKLIYASLRRCSECVNKKKQKRKEIH